MAVYMFKPGMRPPKKGDTFTHKHFLDDEGEHPLMKITAVRNQAVYYTYASSRSNKGNWKMSIEAFMQRYGDDD